MSRRAADRFLERNSAKKAEFQVELPQTHLKRMSCLTASWNFLKSSFDECHRLSCLFCKDEILRNSIILEQSYIRSRVPHLSSCSNDLNESLNSGFIMFSCLFSFYDVKPFGFSTSQMEFRENNFRRHFLDQHWQFHASRLSWKCYRAVAFVARCCWESRFYSAGMFVSPLQSSCLHVNRHRFPWTQK